MDASTLLEQSMGNHSSNRNLGLIVNLEYFFRDGTSELATAFVEVIEKRNERKKERYDAYTFSQMTLTKSPRLNGDYVIYDGLTLIVTRFYKQHGFYIIECNADRAGLNRRVS